jgi:LysM repeat protein
MRYRHLMMTLMIALLCGVTSAWAQQGLPSAAVLEYISTYRAMAVREMTRTGVPASITLAQGILETEAGRSDLVLRSNNHFGIKCKSTWTGERVYHDDDAQGECFRKYAAAEESYRDHSDYLRSQERYASLFRLDAEDYKGWAIGLRKAGYATNPKYAYILIRYIEDYGLQDYTLIALGKKEAYPDMLSGVADANAKRQANTAASLANADAPTRLSATFPASAGTPALPRYPDGEFRFNETRVVFARAGTSLLSIAEQYHVKLGWILDFNDLEPDIESVPADQLVYLQRKRRQGQNEFHVVRQGETLYTISQAEALRMQSLLSFNRLSPGMEPAVGERLYLQAHAPERPRLAAPDMQVGGGKGEVTDGEGSQKHPSQPPAALNSSSRKYEVDSGVGMTRNALPSHDLKAGQELLIPKKHADGKDPRS